ncbi:hypothetical protein [Aureibacter tunicatorum]|uniref:Tissue inhibitor of metalloproteinase n=1 Tax=Aureibacter tunicatorum TaxID=866807 RepID=A0AAE3XLX5_9BACT|nr:hypothetical protein [Aureibacter tunicatorum]MDR6238895.1 hypothetical protein [Aureibacter tunicatorum]BDD05178.1 hypothetical protein AUTU_26610 [Aureibacter tunicatorum]
MRKLLLFTFFLFLMTQQVFACQCEALDSISVSRIFDKAEYIAIGRAIGLASYDEAFLDNFEENTGGFDVYFQIDSVLKGEFKSKIIVINQMHEGSCRKFFRFGEDYLIIGSEVKKFMHYNAYEEKNLPSPAPPCPGMTEVLPLFFPAEKYQADFWNSLINKFGVFVASSCSTFDINSNDAELFFEEHRRRALLK